MLKKNRSWVSRIKKQKVLFSPRVFARHPSREKQTESKHTKSHSLGTSKISIDILGRNYDFIIERKVVSMFLLRKWIRKIFSKLSFLLPGIYWKKKAKFWKISDFCSFKYKVRQTETFSFEPNRWVGLFANILNDRVKILKLNCRNDSRAPF